MEGMPEFVEKALTDVGKFMELNNRDKVIEACRVLEHVEAAEWISNHKPEYSRFLLEKARTAERGRVKH